MNDPDARPFLDAVRAAPDDDAPRLIYADWLEERNTPEDRERATFIREQCAAARLPEDSDERFVLESRAAARLSHWGKRWTRWTPGGAARTGGYERGFVERLHVNAARWDVESPELWERHPAWRDATIRLERDDSPGRASGVPWDRFTRLAFGPGRRLFREMQQALLRPLGGDVLGEETLAALASGESRRRLEELCVWYLAITPAGIDALDRAGEFQSLRSLNCFNCFEEPDAVARLAMSRAFPKLESLTGAMWPIDAGAADALARGPLLRPVRRLELIQCHTLEFGRWPRQIDASLMNALAAGLERCESLAFTDTLSPPTMLDALPTSKSFASLRELRLEGLGELPLLGEAALHATTRLPNLSALTLAGFRFVASPFADWLADPALEKLRRLDLRGSRLARRRDVSPAFDSPRLAGLESLSLGQCELDDEAVARLAASPHFTRLRRLDLSRNRITAEGVRALARSQRLPCLERLDLSRNPLGPEGAEALANNEAWPALMRLSVAHASLTPAGGRALARGKSLSRLLFLDASLNEFDLATARTLVRSELLSSLVSLKLYERGMSRKAVAGLRRRAAERGPLRLDLATVYPFSP